MTPNHIPRVPHTCRRSIIALLVFAVERIFAAEFLKSLTAVFFGFLGCVWESINQSIVTTAGMVAHLGY